MPEDAEVLRAARSTRSNRELAVIQGHGRSDFESPRDLGFGAEAALAIAAEAAPAVAEESPVASKGDGAAPA